MFQEKPSSSKPSEDMIVLLDTKNVAITDADQRAVIKGLLAAKDHKDFAIKVFNIINYRPTLIHLSIAIIAQEATDLCSEKFPSLLQSQKTAENVMKLSLNDLKNEFQSRAPYSMSALKTITRKDGPFITSIMANILHVRNQKMSAYAYKLGLSLDYCGLQNKMISVLQKLGITVSAQALRLKRKEFADRHGKIVNTEFREKVHQRGQLKQATSAMKFQTSCLTVDSLKTKSSGELKWHIRDKSSDIKKAVIKNAF